MNMTTQQAEAILAEYRTRDNAILAGDVTSWDEAYQIAFAGYRAERNFEVGK